MSKEPLPCPFCGHVGLDFADGSTYRWGVASCGGCGASCGEIRREYPDKGGWHDEAIAEWNKRAPTPQPVQVSPLEFVEMVMEKEHLVGNPIFWAEWPNKEKNCADH